MSFTLKINGGAAATLTNLGLSNSRLEFSSLDVDLFTCDQEGPAYTGTPLFAYDDVIEIFNAVGTRVFWGTCDEPMAKGPSGSEGFSYKIVGPWSYVKRIIYQQQANFQNQADISSPTPTLLLQYVSRVILGADYYGDFIETGAQLYAIFTFLLVQCGAPFLFEGGAFADGTQFPAEQANSLTAENAIKRVLRYLLDCAHYFDYSADAPTLYLNRLADCATVTLAVPAPGYNPNNLSGIPTIKPRYDLQVPGVTLRYIYASAPADYGWNVYSVDNYGGGGYTGFQRDSLILDFKLKPGRPAVVLEQTTVTNPLPVPSQVATTDQSLAVALLQLHDLAFSQPNITDLVVSGLEYQALGGDSIGWGDYTSLVNELVGGAYPQWVYDNFEVAADYLQFFITAAWTDTNDITDSNPIGSLHSQTMGPYKFLATDDPGTTWRLTTTAAVIAESPPSGLAEIIYNQLQNLAWEGTVKTVEPEWSGALKPGQKLNFTGGNSDWETMYALVQRVEVNLDTSAAVASFGPPGHIEPQDLVKLTLMAINREPAFDLDSFVSGYDASPAASAGLAIDFPEKPKQHATPETNAAGVTSGYTGPTDGSVVLTAGMQQMLGCDSDGNQIAFLVQKTQNYTPAP